jgi:hypothetical protein
MQCGLEEVQALRSISGSSYIKRLSQFEVTSGMLSAINPDMA